MKKIVIISDETEAPEALMSALAALFPECEIMTASEGTKIPGIEVSRPPSQESPRTNDVIEK